MTHIIPRLLLPALLCLAAPPLLAQEIVSASAQGVEINLVNVDLRSAVQLLSQHMDRPVFFGTVGEHRVTFTSPRPVPRGEIPALLRSLLAEYGYVMEEAEGGVYRIRGQQQAQPAPQAGAFPQPQPGAGGSSLASGSNGTELFVIRLSHVRGAAR